MVLSDRFQLCSQGRVPGPQRWTRGHSGACALAVLDLGGAKGGRPGASGKGGAPYAFGKGEVPCASGRSKTADGLSEDQVWHEGTGGELAGQAGFAKGGSSGWRRSRRQGMARCLALQRRLRQVPGTIRPSARARHRTQSVRARHRAQSVRARQRARVAAS